jgi:hypothetical protein
MTRKMALLGKNPTLTPFRDFSNKGADEIDIDVVVAAKSAAISFQRD